ncbi:MAG: fatty acid kinase fatty acid binding subunit [Nocardioidaceae bacterium]|jgi:DegV family protein with EDD domain|nr:fatty acid kinase fatty acid binding subunit [Nocardioidaceae bacterium]
MARCAALVSDSTSVDPGMASRLDVVVVPLQVVIGSSSYDEGDDASPAMVASALRERKPVSTSRPAPERFARVYREAADAGAEAVVSIHLSGEVSGTVESAMSAARQVGLDVIVVDSRQLGMATGFAVAAAARALDEGAAASSAAEVARARALRTTALFYVDTMEYLRRGGRVGAAAALVGSALSVKPLLKVQDGRIVQLDRVRTSTRALARLEELAVDAAGEQEVDIAVSHLANLERATALAERLRARVPKVSELVMTEVGAVIGAHVGPGMLGVVVSPLAR